MYLIPKPKRVEEKEGNFWFSYKTSIILDHGVGQNGLVYAKILKNDIEKWTGFSPVIVKGIFGPGDILLKQDGQLGEQEYSIDIEENGITVIGGDGAGVLYGVQTLCQIIEQSGGCLSCVQITDKPDLMHRGYYLDETRGRVMKLDYLKETVDLLCRYKINEFQLYIEQTYMFRGISEMWRDETPLMPEEIMELDSYCRERNIELIPSLASFGHLYTLLSTKTYGDMCELPESVKLPFSFWDRMHHHTINVSDDRALPLIKGMLEEYMELFSSDQFNICADETFDLGKGKSKALAEEKGLHRIYIDYVKELCNFLVQKGKKPMFWGDVICNEPFLVQELPESITCLTWGYSPDVTEDTCRKMAETGVRQYLCPGVAGWDQWMNRIEDSYKNIVKMCNFAEKYHAVGILNTDWGDFGHINQPRFSTPGIIYGAAFSWNREEIPYEEMNRRISKLEYGDSTERIVALMAEISQHIKFQWVEAVKYHELGTYKIGETAGSNETLEKLRRELVKNSVYWNENGRRLMKHLDVTIEGIQVWNDIGSFVKRRETGGMVTDFALAKSLETWFMAFKELWRRDSKEGDLHHVSDVVFWYADMLRNKQRQRIGWEK